MVIMWSILCLWDGVSVQIILYMNVKECKFTIPKDCAKHSDLLYFLRADYKYTSTVLSNSPSRISACELRNTHHFMGIINYFSLSLQPPWVVAVSVWYWKKGNINFINYFRNNTWLRVSQVAERLGNRATNLKVACSIPGRAKWRCVLGQGTSPYLPRGNVPVLTVSRSG